MLLKALTKRSSAACNEGSSSQPYGSFPPDPAEVNALHQQTLCPGSEDRSKETSGWKEAELASKINDALLRQIEVCQLLLFNFIVCTSRQSYKSYELNFRSVIIFEMRNVPL